MEEGGEGGDLFGECRKEREGGGERTRRELTFSDGFRLLLALLFFRLVGCGSTSPKTNKLLDYVLRLLRVCVIRRTGCRLDEGVSRSRRGVGRLSGRIVSRFRVLFFLRNFSFLPLLTFSLFAFSVWMNTPGLNDGGFNIFIDGQVTFFLFLSLDSHRCLTSSTLSLFLFLPVYLLRQRRPLPKRSRSRFPLSSSLLRSCSINQRLLHPIQTIRRWFLPSQLIRGRRTVPPRRRRRRRSIRSVGIDRGRVDVGRIGYSAGRSFDDGRGTGSAEADMGGDRGGTVAFG